MLELILPSGGGIIQTSELVKIYRLYKIKYFRNDLFFKHTCIVIFLAEVWTCTFSKTLILTPYLKRMKSSSRFWNKTPFISTCWLSILYMYFRIVHNLDDTPPTGHDTYFKIRFTHVLAYGERQAGTQCWLSVIDIISLEMYSSFSKK